MRTKEVKLMLRKEIEKALDEGYAKHIPLTSDYLADKILAALDSDVIYYHYLFTQYVAEDIESHSCDMGLELEAAEVDLITERYVYDGKYDCNLSYWDNIENLINEVIAQR